MALPVGTRLGRYEVRSQIGAGGMGEVYLAWDSELERRVALKVLPVEVAGDPQRLERFLREAKAASALNHPNILTVYDAGQADALPFIVTEYIDGESLRSYIARSAVDLRQTLEISIQIASALAEAHQADIVHRDIKPENVMLRGGSAVKVLDFGLAKLNESSRITPLQNATTHGLSATRPGVVLGSAGYMAPEQARGLPVDARADLFSLGVIIYELVTGRRPFSGHTATDLLVAVVRDQPAPLSEAAPRTPTELHRIVTKLLEKDPDERYQTAKEVLVDLKRLKRSVEHDAEPRVPRRRRGVPVTLGIAVVVIALALGAYALFSRSTKEEPGRATVRPLTSYPAIERGVAFSPDGRQIAFAWVGPGVLNFDIYVQLIGAGVPLRLTTSPGRDMSPTWSPDGRHIAFFRGTGDDKGFYVVPALGGAERKVTFAYGWRQIGIAPHMVAWSPGGGTLAIVDKESDAEPWSIYLVSVDSGERRKLTRPASATAGDQRVAFSPDGEKIAFARTTNVTAVYTVNVAGGDPAHVTSMPEGVMGLAWTASGRELIFSSALQDQAALWRVPATGGTPSRISGFGDGAHELSISRDGQQLAYARVSLDTDIYRWDAAPDRSNLASAAPRPVASSTLEDAAARFSPDGNLIAFVSERSGHAEIWRCSRDGENPIQLTNFNGPEVRTPAWSPEGNEIAFIGVVDGNSHIYSISSSGGRPRVVHTEATQAHFPEWSPDGRSIYFTSRRSGIYEIWKVPATGGAAVQVTSGGGSTPRAVNDEIYFAKEFGTETSLWKIPAAGGSATRVFDPLVWYDAWVATDRGVYYVARGDGIQIHFFNAKNGSVESVTSLGQPRANQLATRLDVTRDHRTILYTDRVRLEFDLMLVEGFDAR